MNINNGVYSVIMTPFNENFSIDYDSYNKLLDKTDSSDITGVVVLGTTSESPTLSLVEKRTLVSLVWNRFKGKKKVVVGIGGNNTIATLKFALEVKDQCDYMMITVPNYNKPSQNGIQSHFEFVCNNEELQPIPFILYNVPSRCGVGLEPATICNVYNSCQNVCAIKEASGSLEQAINIRSLCDIQLFSGDDSLTVPIMSIGGSGVISVVANILPEQINQVYMLCSRNNYDEATKKYIKLHPVIKGLFIESNPVPGKELLRLTGIFKNNIPRLPLVQMSDENTKIVHDRYYTYMKSMV